VIRVVAIDDEVQIRRFLRICLERNDFRIYDAANGEEGLRQILNVKPDLILLDLGLPDMDGRDVLASLREWSSVPVIILSVRNTEDDIVALLNAGADDYMIKPFNTGELIARIRVALRHRNPEPAEQIFSAGVLTVDVGSREVKVEGKEIKLTPTEYALLRLFIQHAGKVLTHQQILREVWGPNMQEEYNYLRVYITQLRKKIELNPARPQVLLTEPGVGYRLKI
jgi:two-component system, OmpR family, KDP operon response regulator KdpE